MSTRPENGHDDDGVLNIVVNSTWCAGCVVPDCVFGIDTTDDRGPAIDSAQTHVRETGHEVTFVAQIQWQLSKAP